MGFQCLGDDNAFEICEVDCGNPIGTLLLTSLSAVLT